MIGDPSQFEAIGIRLGFSIVEDSRQRLRLSWQGARFPAFLCVGIAVLLLFVSVPILQAALIARFHRPRGIAVVFPFDESSALRHCDFSGHPTAHHRIRQRGEVLRALSTQSLPQDQSTASFDEIEEITLSIDRVSSGFAIGGSTAAESFPVPALTDSLQRRPSRSPRSR